MDLGKFVRQTADDSFNEAARHLTSDFRQYALSHGWPLGFLLRTRVVYNANIDEFDVEYPDDIKQRVEDMEFGTQNSPPNPIIRTFMNRLPKSTISNFSDKFEQEILNRVSIGA